MKIAYEPHPVSPERKAELRAKGYRIIDARFQPESEKPEKDDATAAASSVPEKPEEIDTMPKGEVRGWLEAHNAEIPTGATVRDMRAALKRLMFVDL